MPFIGLFLCLAVNCRVVHTVKRVFSDIFNRCGDNDGFEGKTASECIIANVGKRNGNCNLGKLYTFIKRMVCYVSDVIKVDREKRFTAAEGVFSD